MMKNTGNKERRFLSLIELMVVLLVFSLLSTAIGFKVAALIQQYRFQTAAETVLSRLLLAQEAMLNLRADLDLHLTMTEKGLTCTLEGDQGTLQALRIAHRATITLSAIKRCEFEGQAISALTLHFASGGGFMTQGHLQFCSEKNPSDAEYSAWCLLPDYPASLTLTPQKTSFQPRETISYPAAIAKELE